VSQKSKIPLMLSLCCSVPTLWPFYVEKQVREPEFSLFFPFSLLNAIIKTNQGFVKAEAKRVHIALTSS